MEVCFSAKKNSTLKSSTELDSVMYGLPILPFRNNLKNFTWSLRPSDSHPPVSPPAPPISPSLPSHFFQLYFRPSCKPYFSSPISSIFTAGSHDVQFTAAITLNRKEGEGKQRRQLHQTKPKHWFLRISFNICEFTFLSTLHWLPSTMHWLPPTIDWSTIKSVKKTFCHGDSGERP